MKPVITPHEMFRLENEAYKEGSIDEKFMEAAGLGIAKDIKSECERKNFGKRALILAGKGNNGGDALVVARYLIEAGFDVSLYAPFSEKECSPLFKKQLEIYNVYHGEILQSFPTPEILKKRFDFIVDGFFGTGFKGSLEEPCLSAVLTANASKLPIFAVDIPSGLNGETGRVEGAAIIAFKTYYLGLPKKGYFLHQGWNHVGRLEEIDFGLPEKIAAKASGSFSLIDKETAKKLLPPLVRSRHKYQAGYVVGLAGSKAMPGAAMLAGLAALRSGSGLVRLLIPEGSESQFSSAPYELIKTTYKPSDAEKILTEINKASACFVGPGLTTEPEVGDLLAKLLPRIECPAVIDADALTLIAERHISLPPTCLLTPHTGEMARLLHKDKPQEIGEEFLRYCQEYTQNKLCTLILKGGPSWIFQAGAKPLINPTGNPGMATAGSGDVLTGVLASLLSQGLKGPQAATLGVFLHGLAGDIAEEKKGAYSLIASDIIENISSGYRLLN